MAKSLKGTHTLRANDERDLGSILGVAEGGSGLLDGLHLLPVLLATGALKERTL
jgi:hypothetical protein